MANTINTNAQNKKANKLNGIWTKILIVFVGLFTLWSVYNLLTPPFIKSKVMSCPASTPLIGGFESSDPAYSVTLRANFVSIVILLAVVVLGIFFTYSLFKPHTRKYKALLFLVSVILIFVELGVLLVNSHFC